MRRLSKLSVRAYLFDDRVAVGSLLLPGKMGESLLLVEGACNSPLSGREGGWSVPLGASLRFELSRTISAPPISVGVNASVSVCVVPVRCGASPLLVCALPIVGEGPCRAGKS